MFLAPRVLEIKSVGSGGICAVTNPGRRIESLVSRMAPHQTPFSAERGCSGARGWVYKKRGGGPQRRNSHIPLLLGWPGTLWTNLSSLVVVSFWRSLQNVAKDGLSPEGACCSAIFTTDCSRV